MAKFDKRRYAEENGRYLEDLAGKDGVNRLPNGVLYKVLESGEGKMPTLSDVVSVYYSGSLINGKEFDDNMEQPYPDSFRLRELIAGWQMALTRMKEGDRWMLYIPASQGYGSRGDSDIPGNSTLIFDIRLVKVN